MTNVGGSTLTCIFPAHTNSKHIWPRVENSSFWTISVTEYKIEDIVDKSILCFNYNN